MTEGERQRNRERADRLLSEQNFRAAAIGGAGAALLSALAYGIATATWSYLHGFAAASIGIVVGLTMQFLGRGIETRFAVLASIYTIVGCLLGNACREVIDRAKAGNVSPIEVMGNADVQTFLEWTVSSGSPVSLVYWLVGVVFAVFLVKRPLSRSDRLAIGTHELGN